MNSTAPATPAATPPAAGRHPVDVLIRIGLVVSGLGLLAAVVVSVVAMSIPSEDANLGLVNGILIGLPMLPPLLLTLAALATRGRWPQLAFGLAIAAVTLLGLGALSVAAVYLPTLF